MWILVSESWDFEHDTSSPNYPESNGLVERTIQTVKKTLKKAFREDQDPYLALLAIKVSYGPYTSTPPATLMCQRPIRSLPSVKSKRKMEVMKLKKREINDENKKLKETSKFKEYNRLQINDKVRLHDGNAWNIKGIIINTSQHSRLYIIKTDKGTVVRRNRKHNQFNVREKWW